MGSLSACIRKDWICADLCAVTEGFAPQGVLIALVGPPFPTKLALKLVGSERSPIRSRLTDLGAVLSLRSTGYK